MTWVMHSLRKLTFSWVFQTQLLNNYWSYDNKIYKFMWNNFSSYDDEQMSLLTVQVTEIFDLNGKPQKG